MEAEKKTESLGRLLTIHQRDLLEQAQALIHIERQLLQQLSAELRPHVRVARCDDEIMVLIVDDPAWATKIRFMADEILSGLAQLSDTPCPHWLEVRVGRVSLPTASASIKPMQAEPIGHRGREALESVAATSDNHRLADILRRIARGSRSQQK